MSNERPPIGGRRGEKGIDDIRPDGICYADSINAHRKFCESLGNRTINTNIEQGINNVQQQSQFIEKTEGQR